MNGQAPVGIGGLAVFGIIFGIFLAIIGLGIVQDIVIGLEASGETCADNPIPVADWFVPEICQEAGIGGEVRVSGIGVVVLYSILILVFVIIFSVFMITLLIPPLRMSMYFLILFAIFFVVGLLLAWFIGLAVLSIILIVIPYRRLKHEVGH